jgi:hypothetical protein
VTVIDIAEEVVPRRAFAWAVDWPGWCRSGRSPTLAREALVVAWPRYAAVAARAGLTLPEVSEPDLRVVEAVDGSAGTEFGVPSAITAFDRRPTTAAEADRLSALVAAAWTLFDEVVARSPEVLRKGPRGGGRDRDTMLAHVIGADHAYAREIGVRHRPPDPADRSAVEAERAAMLDVLIEPSDGGPLAGRRWTQRYAARRIAWHALDHAWEIEDRAAPTP